MRIVGLLAVFVMVIVALTADYFLKIAGTKSPFFNRYFIAGFILYSLTTFIWYFVMKNVKFSEANLLYSLFTVLAAVGIGRYIFNERLNIWETVAVCTAIGSIVVLSRFG